MESEELGLDEFFQRLREIQKKERSTSGLADVGDNFYKEVYNYLNMLRKKIGDNPLSFSSYLHRDARRIATEICERREYKIINSALLYIQKSQELFADSSSKNKNKPPALPPQNMTAEEEILYHSITKSFSRYRKDNIYSLNGFKIKGSDAESKIETAKSKSNAKSTKKIPFSIEHDIESYQANEIPIEHENVQEINESDLLNSSNIKNNEVKTVMVLEEIPSIMGMDREIYGPLVPQDIVIMPEANAQIIINNNKGKFIKKDEKIDYR